MRRLARLRRRLDGRFLETDAPAAAIAVRVVGDEDDAGRVERGDQLHERIDGAANDAVARLHPLDGRRGEAGEFRQLPLIDADEGACGAQLCGGDHERAIDRRVRRINDDILTIDRWSNYVNDDV